MAVFGFRLPQFLIFACVFLLFACNEDIHNIPDKIRNATRRTVQLSGRSQVMGQFRLYRCTGMSGTAA